MKPARALAIKITLISLLSLLVIGYVLYQARNLINGPEITIYSPKNGENVENPLVVITGKATNISHISLNDRQIFINNQGNFSEKLLVPPGYTIIKLAAQDRFGRTTQRLIELNYTAPPKPAATSTATSTPAENLSASSTDIIQ